MDQLRLASNTADCKIHKRTLDRSAREHCAQRRMRRHSGVLKQLNVLLNIIYCTSLSLSLYHYRYNNK